MTLPASASSAFRLSAAELGMCSAARLFAAELHAAGGAPLLEEARDRIGPDYPIFDIVASETLEGRPPARINPASVVTALGSAKLVLVIGIEAYFLDALVAALPAARIGLVLGEGGLEGERRRILANFGGRVEDVPLSDVLRWAGRRSAMLTFIYGTVSTNAYVAPVWLRVAGPDVRPQFRTLVGWDVLNRAPALYPRWVVEAPLEPFSCLVGI